MTGGCAMSRDECAAAARCDAAARRAPSGALWKQLCMSTVLLALAAIARSCLRTRRTAAACVVLLSVAAQMHGAGAQLSPRDRPPPAVQDGGVCGSVDIRNSVSEFSQLTNCSVVEGFVRILLIEGAEEQHYKDLAFPKLTEITGYLLLYRASGLHSLAKLFPNLAVIRGNMLMLNYALVSFEMMNLRELGLHSLREIVRGGVRFEKNPNLCFADTIDWDVIAPNAIGLHIIKGNREKNECPMCPSNCPAVSQSANGLVNQPLCWNSQHCQALCPSVCVGGCSPSGACCDENCLGGCSDSPTPSLETCAACRDVQHNGRCIKRCPVNTFQYLQRRCVSEAECYAMPLPVEATMPERNTTWKPFNMTACILDCPAGTEEKMEKNRLVCGECKGQCRRECHGHNVDSIASAQKLRGCTHINGALEIQVTGGKNVVKELEDNLGLIEEIDGYLKVVRSFPLISLGFLRSLRVIHGTTLESNRHALVVLDNQNLQELWDWDSRGKLEIRNGRLSFHFNPKLCMKQIKRLNQIANLSQYTELEVAPNSNGDKVTCNLTVLNAWIESTMPVAAIISWDRFEHYDERLLLGYVVYSIVAPFANLTLYDGRDACGTDGWLVDDVVPSETKQILSHLKPHTQYAFYVKTYMIATEDSGAQSPIQYFMTEPDVPSVPQALKVFANSSTELVIRWQPPLTPNGNVTYYIVTAQRDSDNTPFLSERNYCRDPVMQMEKKVSRTTEAPIAASTTPTCACEEKGDKIIRQEEVDQRMWSIHFEDMLQNIVYVKKWRRRRNVSALLLKNHTEPDRIELEVRGNMAVLTGLRHYSQYSVTVRACRELTREEQSRPANLTVNCSQKSLDTARTLPLPGADNVSHVAVGAANHSLGEVRLAWEEPVWPNGLVVAYHIEYRRQDIEHHKPTEECITQQQFESFGRSYSLKRLAPGNYSVRVRATSLAGNGNFAPAAVFQIRVEADTSALGWILGGIAAAVSLAFIAIGAVLYMRHRYLGGGAMKLIASVNPEYMSTVYVPDEWEVPRKKVELLRELGQGSFGMVYEGVVKDLPMLAEPATRCAVKTVGEHASNRERSEFLNEASVMKGFHTHHVVQLLGVVSLGQPVLVVMELMTHGDLKTYLRSHRPDTGGDPTVLPPSLSRVLRMAAEIADGMAYLAAKKFVHRDLAARNCMVADDLTVKIGDFGMTRDIYETDYYRKGTKGLLPVRWMAPESLKDGVFTSRSDVWSYGVVLWEMATLASQPYQGLSNDQVLRYVIDGGVMERPDNCPERLSQLMERCWQHRPMARPSFLHLVSTLLEDLTDVDAFRLVSFYHTPEAAELRAPAALGPDDIDLGSDDEFPARDALHGEPHLGEPLLGEANGSAGPKLVGNGCTTPTSLQTTAC